MLLIGGLAMLVLFALLTVSTIFSIGKYREPITPGMAVFAVSANLVSIFIIYSLMLAAHV